MNTPNKDQKVKHAIKDINNCDSIPDILAYIALDDRSDVIDAAKLRIAEIDVNFEFPQAPGAGPSSPAQPAPGAASPSTGSGQALQKQGLVAGSQGPGEAMKQGQIQTITQTPKPLPEFKMIRKEAKSSVITIRDGKAVTVEFDEDGKEIK